MSEKTIQLNGVKSTRKQRLGRVTIYLRGKIWYLYYRKNGRWVRRRVGVLLADANPTSDRRPEQMVRSGSSCR